MKKRISILAILFASSVFTVSPIAFIGCKTAPDQHVVAVQTLEVVGATAKSTMDGATTLLKSGQITVEKWQKIATYYDGAFQPAYAVAVQAAHSDLSTLASPDVVSLATNFATLVAQLTAKPAQ